jgi:hypothetical protein
MLRSPASKSSSSFALFSSFSRIIAPTPPAKRASRCALSSPFSSCLWASRLRAAATFEAAGVGFYNLQRLPKKKKSAEACFRTHPRRFASFASSSLLERGETRRTKKRSGGFFERQRRRATRAFVSPLQFVADTTFSAAFSSSAASSSPSLSVSSSMVSVAWIIGAASIVDFGIQFVGWAISSAKKT